MNFGPVTNLPWLHDLVAKGQRPEMPWTLLESVPSVPWVVMHTPGGVRFRMFRPAWSMCPGDTIE